MWAIGLLAGAALAATVDGALALPGALLGALIGAAATRRIESRLAELDAKARYLYERVSALEAQLATRGDAAQAQGPASATDTATAGPITAAGDPASIADQAAPLAPHQHPTMPADPSFAAPSALSTPIAVGPRLPLWQRLLTGNLLAKVGVVLLFFGVASALRLAAEYGLLPIRLRLAGAAAAALVMITFGWRQRATRPAFALALQGGGYGLGYLVVYFMLGRFSMLDPLPAFAAFAVLGSGCALQAARQDGHALAMLGIAGAFLAPALAGPAGDGPVVLFGYFALLNGFVLAIALSKEWPSLTLAGMVLTFAVGVNWWLKFYSPSQFAITELFLLLHFFVYSLAPVLSALRHSDRTPGITDSALVFATPILVTFLQQPLLEPFDRGLALWAAPAGCYYLALSRWLDGRGAPRGGTLARAQRQVAVALLTLAIPFALGVQATVAAWALEGAAAVWLGHRHDRRWLRLAGVALQLVAGVHLLAHAPDPSGLQPLANARFFDAVIIAGCSVLSGALLARGRHFERQAAVVLVFWALAWWLSGALAEIVDFIPGRWRPAACIVLASATLAAADLFGARRCWLALRIAAAVLTGLLPAAAFWQWESHLHPAGYGGWLAWPMALATHFWVLLRHERDGLDRALAARHAAGLWLVAVVLTLELVWQAGHFAARLPLTETLAYGVGPGAVLALALTLTQRAPLARWSGTYVGAGAAPLVAWLTAWGIALNVDHSGRFGSWPYLPFANPLDAVQAGVLAALLAWSARLSLPTRGVARLGVATLAFVWLSAMAARVLHHWTGVPFDWPAIFDSIVMQATWSLLWSILALALMLRATRNGRRGEWFAGFGLLALVGAKLLLVDTAHVNTVGRTVSLLGVALVVIAASYFAPTPPKRARDGIDDEGI